MQKSATGKRTLGKRGLEVTEIGVGLWTVGGTERFATDNAEILNLIDAALEAGGNSFDTADAYGYGHGEELLGKAMTGRQDRFIGATKIGWLSFDRRPSRSACTTVDRPTAGVESSLKPRKTDFIDVIQSQIR